MEKVLLILESDITEKLLREALPGCEVVGCHADRAVDILAQLRPDALVLDLFLPGTDGLTILESCREVLPPVVLVISPMVTEYIQKKAVSLGVGYLIQKPCSISYIVSRLTDMLLMQRIPELSDNGSIVDDLILQFQIYGKPRTIAVLRNAILIALNNPDGLLTKDVYPALCKEYGGSQEAIDQAIRRLLRNAWKHRENNASIWNAVFPHHTKCPTNQEFIISAALFLQKKYPSRFRKGS